MDAQLSTGGGQLAEDMLRDATPGQLEHAAAANHRELFGLNALARGGEVVERQGIAWTYAGPGRDSMVAFPALSEEDAGPVLDEMVEYYEQRMPIGVGCWSLTPSCPSDLDVRLLARGFQTGWRPTWMALDLSVMKTKHSVPPSLDLRADNGVSLGTVKNLPNAGEQSALSEDLLKVRPDRVMQFVARYRKRIVGHSAVLLGTGPKAVAGIYNVGVVPSQRGRGIGKALVIAACLYARERGYHYATLNGTGRRMYEQIGFEWVGSGYTWWLKGERLLRPRGSAALVALTEAIGRGDIAAVEETGRTFTLESLARPLRNGMTLVQLAIHCRQPDSAVWLKTRGVPFSVLDVWDMGWRDQAAEMLAADPAAVNQRYGEWGATLLHIAAERDDAALASLALSARPDLKIRDAMYMGTPLSWAMHLNKPQIAELIQTYETENFQNAAPGI